MHIFRRILLSNYWWQKSDIWSQASYRYPIWWEAFFDPSDSYFLFAEERGNHKWALAHSSSCFVMKNTHSAEVMSVAYIHINQFILFAFLYTCWKVNLSFCYCLASSSGVNCLGHFSLFSEKLGQCESNLPGIILGWFPLEFPGWCDFPFLLLTGISPHDDHRSSGPRPVKLCSDQ
jgi:hypothetical protein